MSNNIRVVVTGVGVLAPNGSTKEDFCAALKVGKSGIRYHEYLNVSGFSCHLGGVPQISEEKIKQYLTEEDLKSMSQTTIYTAIAGIDAWIDAGFKYDKNNRNHYYENIGAIIGVGFGGGESVINKLAPRLLDKRISRLGSNGAELCMASCASAKLGGLLGLGEKVSTVSNACITGVESITDAFNYIKYGNAKLMLAGGVESSDKSVWASFDAMKVTNRKMNDKPEQASRPFSATASGFVPSGGAGILVLESLDSALERGAEIYCEIIGAKTNCGGHRNGGTMIAPSKKGIELCIDNAFKQANIKPEEINVINGHFPGTMIDSIEVNSWKSVLGLESKKMPLIQSTKSMIGHCLGAAGGLESLACVLQIKYNFIHKTINCEDLHPNLEEYNASINYETKEMPVNIIAKSSFGMGDVNGCLIFKRY